MRGKDNSVIINIGTSHFFATWAFFDIGEIKKSVDITDNSKAVVYSVFMAVFITIEQPKLIRNIRV